MSIQFSPQCPFCHTPAEYISGGKFACNDCCTSMILVFDIYENLEWISFKDDRYQIHLQMQNHQTYVYDDRFKIWEKPMFILNYIVPINPSNYQYWIRKLSKLKAFA